MTMNSDRAFAVFESIRTLSGHSKIHALNMNPAVSRYVLAAYNPYVRYYITKCLPGKGDQQFTEDTFTLLRMLSTRELSGHAAQKTVNDITKRMTPTSAELFKRILKKDLRMGMGAKTINKALPGLVPTHDVMLAKAHFEPHRLSYPCFGSPKVDGVRGKFKAGKFYSRNGHEYVGLDHLQEQLKDIREEIDGELVVPGVSFQVGSGWIRSDDPTPDAEFHIIELPTVKDNLITRLNMIWDLHQYGPQIMQIPRRQLYSETEVYNFYKTCRQNGFEGSIITPYDYEYVGARSWNWMKLKPLETYDAKVIGIYEGKGKYEGQMGGVIVEYNGKEQKVGGGWSDYQRKLYWDNPSLILDRMIEVHFMEETDAGNFRHARFHDFRPDKEV